MRFIITICIFLILPQSAAAQSDASAQLSALGATQSVSSPNPLPLLKRMRALTDGKSVILSRLIRSQSTSETTFFAVEYRKLLQVSPWKLSLNFALLPSNNIERRGKLAFFDTSAGRFYIDGGGTSKFGFDFQYGTSLTFETMSSNRSLLSYKIGVIQRESPALASQSTVITPELSWRLFYPNGNLQITGYSKNYIQDDETNQATSLGISLSLESFLKDGASIGSQFRFESKFSGQELALTDRIIDTSLEYRRQVSGKLSASVSGGATWVKSQTEHLSYFGSRASLSLTYAATLNSTVKNSLYVSYRDHLGEYPFFGFARQDNNVRFTTSFSDRRIAILGIEPEFTCGVQVNDSNIPLYIFEATECGINFSRNF